MDFPDIHCTLSPLWPQRFSTSPLPQVTYRCNRYAWYSEDRRFIEPLQTRFHTKTYVLVLSHLHDPVSSVPGLFQEHWDEWAGWSTYARRGCRLLRTDAIRPGSGYARPAHTPCQPGGQYAPARAEWSGHDCP